MTKTTPLDHRNPLTPLVFLPLLWLLAKYLDQSITLSYNSTLSPSYTVGAELISIHQSNPSSIISSSGELASDHFSYGGYETDPRLASPLLSTDQEALLGAFPKANDAVDAGPFDLLAETHEEVTQQSCKQPWGGLPEKQVKNTLPIYLHLSIYFLCTIHIW